MKKIAALAILTTAVLSPIAHAQTATNKLAADIAIRCMATNAPKNWDTLVSWIDRSNPKILAVSALSHVAGSKENTSIQVCDNFVQAQALAALADTVPASESAWKALFIRANNKGQFNVFTDVSLAKTIGK
ncbi:hypothetical protein DTO96_101863 [Ephemeroptericola cinctiostellae]|uniref:Uncharacterized protein n=1 Tax=Ephemeroptericola cinctiostellae TaxID=2268024 RepID=A0A345DCN4_9BURK|nr:hypothetical protein [Ephemeroptericola cinctiostellae]AXF86122.1 hypothetical protein DTO96_101863 [Ephemeroptericola cinctiostellae]